MAFPHLEEIKEKEKNVSISSGHKTPPLRQKMAWQSAYKNRVSPIANWTRPIRKQLEIR